MERRYVTAAGTLQLGKIGAFTAFYPAMANTENHSGGAVLADRAPYSNETLRIRVHRTGTWYAERDTHQTCKSQRHARGVTAVARNLNLIRRIIAVDAAILASLLWRTVAGGVCTLRLFLNLWP